MPHHLSFHDFLQTLLERAQVQRSRNAYGSRDIVNGSMGFEPIQEPQSLLRKGQWERAIAGQGDEWGNAVFSMLPEPRFDGPRQVGHGRSIE
jgi:hypothetical protein